MVRRVYIDFNSVSREYYLMHGAVPNPNRRQSFPDFSSLVGYLGSDDPSARELRQRSNLHIHILFDNEHVVGLELALSDIGFKRPVIVRGPPKGDGE